MLQVMSNVDINVDNVDISIGGAVCVLCALLRPRRPALVGDGGGGNLEINSAWDWGSVRGGQRQYLGLCSFR